MSIFGGGCTLEAAEEVCDAELDTLQSLVDKSLLRHTEERFWMLETFRELAAERVEESSNAEELRKRHAAYFLALFEARDDARRRGRERLSEYVSLVRGEQDNARGASAWYRATPTKRLVSLSHSTRCGWRALWRGGACELPTDRGARARGRRTELRCPRLSTACIDVRRLAGLRPRI